ncbi:ABC transporter ATP-binding protein [Legionella sp. CNM-4043-24]|uniref:ABC transporter ATP-binding protein n=1 Tax=Legionella sp. CNM-4043-24 TaxID=3421646 RepID=UPI00403A83AD
MIIAQNVSKSYKVQGRRKLVFENLSFRVERGERLALVGPNGAGKSTLLRLLCGVEKPNKGTIERTSTISWPVGVGTGFMPHLTARENTKFICRLMEVGREEMQQKIAFIEAFAEIGDYFDMPLKTYSSGMRSRVTFGISMAFDFDFYVVDESLSVGDGQFKKKSEQVFAQKSQDKGMLMVSHSMGTLRKFCNRGIFINKGNILQSNDIEEIIGLYESLTKVVATV